MTETIRTSPTPVASETAPGPLQPGGSSSISVVQTEDRTYPAPQAFAEKANVDRAEHDRLLAEGEQDPVGFWERAAGRLRWDTPWHTAHTWSPAVPVEGGEEGELTVPEARWFLGGRLNVAVNCVDRHVDEGRGDKVAIYAEGERGDRRAITYAELQDEVSRAANALTALGVGEGDRVIVYLPVIAETIVVTLAIARIGAIHSLVFGGFSAEAVRFRVEDTGAKLLVTSDGQFRRGAAVEVKSAADAAVAGLDHVEHVLVVRRTGQDVAWTPGRDVWWHDVVDTASPVHEARSFDSETPLFIIYTSGTTGKPKGLLHTSGGYLTQASWTHWAHFDAKPDDVHWCTADLAWVTAHTYEIYGPLANGLTQVIYEGTPDTPSRTRHLEIIERYGVTTYYTAPTLIRTLMTWFPDGLPPEHDLSSVRLLGTVGEAINPEAWVWFREQLGAGTAPVVDTWWQSETGATMIAPLPGSSTLKPGSATRPSPGLSVKVVDEAGAEVPYGSGGRLVVDRPWPGMARTIWRDPQRYLDAYWRTYAGAGADGQGYFLAGDGASYDADGDIWLLGRLDDVINVSGHRLSTIEIESALVAHPGVGEAGVAGVDDPVTGQAITAFVIPSRAPAALDDTAAWRAASAAVQDELRAHVATAIGPVAKPRRVVLVPDLPKTRSGKIMRRLLAQVHDRTTLGDVTSLQNAHVLDQIHHLLHGEENVPVPQPDLAQQTEPAQQEQHDEHDTQHHATKELSR
ncbi:acetyl-coenzyme A synthetase [Sanguibacter keddieii DSM 10542]|uniref:Acetate--CoA ligase n=1 Tax=Sanguibacter keddieii (strain ATCC 51767 / DSM 10542 / NCFB 3025 / ST-74) TaxID=446469 RepID=D1BHD9_SANKS|nr:acetate--CoA ligase [Sanguibacter keddieii]ACZ21859.1 acetyl-coenzyme A synthetase [Sanguibacter keddieii DSM 10542]